MPNKLTNFFENNCAKFPREWLDNVYPAGRRRKVAQVLAVPDSVLYGTICPAPRCNETTPGYHILDGPYYGHHLWPDWSVQYTAPFCPICTSGEDGMHNEFEEFPIHYWVEKKLYYDLDEGMLEYMLSIQDRHEKERGSLAGYLKFAREQELERDLELQRIEEEYEQELENQKHRKYDHGYRGDLDFYHML